MPYYPTYVSPAQKVFAVILPLCTIAVFLSYLIPQWFAFLTSDVFVYTNGWDEEHYLSLQGIVALMNRAGYFPLHLNLVLHHLGLSGAVQNLIFDSILPPLTAFLAFLTFRQLKIDLSKSIAYATIVCFGSVLFNASNPLVSWFLGDTRSATRWLMSGWEVYPSILRTLNPEVPFFLLSIAVYVSIRFNRWWVLFLPLPLLYYYTAVAYLFLLVLIFIYQHTKSKYFKNSELLAFFTASVLATILLSVGQIAMFWLQGMYNPGHIWRADSSFLNATRKPQLPIVMVVLGLMFLLGHMCRVIRIKSWMMTSIVILAVASLGTVNLHVVSGFMLSQKNYYDYGLSVFFSLAVLIGLEAIRNDLLRNATLTMTLVTIAIFSHQSQRHWFKNGMLLSREMAPSIERLRADPLHAIIPKAELSAHVAFSTPLLPAPPFSYTYVYPGMLDQCAKFPDLLANAKAFAVANLPPDDSDLKEIVKWATAIKSNADQYWKSKPDQSYCKNFNFDRNDDFYFAGPRTTKP